MFVKAKKFVSNKLARTRERWYLFLTGSHYKKRCSGIVININMTIRLYVKADLV